MSLREAYRSSFVRKVWEFLFLERGQLKLSETFVGSFFVRLPGVKHSALFALAAVALLWYEAPIEGALPILGNDFLPPVLLLLALLFSFGKDFVLKRYHYWLLVFLLFALGSGFWGVVQGYGRWEIILGWSVFAQFGLALLVGNVLGRQGFNKAWLLLASFPLVLQGAYMFFVEGVGSRYSNLETSGQRLVSFIENPNVLGFVMVVMVLVAWGIFEERKQYLSLIVAVIFLPFIFLTGSRTAWLALGTASLTLLVARNKKMVLATPATLLLLSIPRIRERALVAFRPEYRYDAAIDGRIWSFNNALHVFKQNLFGVGPGAYGGRFAQSSASPVYLQSMQNGYTALYTTDNEWLAILVQTGIFGALSFLGFLIALGVRFVVTKKLWALALLLGFLVMMSFSNALEFGSVAIPIGIMLGQELAE